MLLNVCYGIGNFVVALFDDTHMDGDDWMSVVCIVKKQILQYAICSLKLDWY